MIHVWFDRLSAAPLIWCLVRYPWPRTTIICGACSRGSAATLGVLRKLWAAVPAAVRHVDFELATMDGLGRNAVVEVEQRLSKIAEWA